MVKINQAPLPLTYSQLLIIQTFEENSKKFELLGAWVIKGKNYIVYRKQPEGKWKLLRVSGRFEL